MQRTRLAGAAVIVSVMIALQWVGSMGNAVEPVLLGMPVQFTYYLAYSGLSVGAIWAVFRLVWPAS
jgi:hypothetical protein